MHIKNWTIFGSLCFFVGWLLFVYVGVSFQPDGASSFMKITESFPSPYFLLMEFVKGNWTGRSIAVAAVIGLPLLASILIVTTGTSFLDSNELGIKPEVPQSELIGVFLWLMTSLAIGLTSARILSFYGFSPFIIMFGSSICLQLILVSAGLLYFTLTPMTSLTEIWSSSGGVLQSVLEGILSYLRFYPWVLLFVVFNYALLNYLDISHSVSRAVIFIESASGPFQWMLMIVLVCVIGPVVEELFFRGIIYTNFRSLISAPMAALLNGVVFGLFHLEAPIFLPLTVLGVILAVVYERTDSVWTISVMHSMQNILSLILVLIVR